MGTATPSSNGRPDAAAGGASIRAIPAEAPGGPDGGLLDLLPGAVYFCDHEGVLVRWNRRAVELWGREPKTGDRSERFCGSYKLYRLDGTFMAHADCPVAEALVTGRPQRNIEAIIERPDGSRRFILANIDALRDDAGTVAGAVNILQDITDRKQAEAALRQSEQRFRRLLDNLPAAGYTCDTQGHITYFNRRAVELWGREPKLNDPVDRHCGSFKLFSTDGSPIVHDQCWMALALRDERDYNGQEIFVERPDGSRRTALAHASPFHDEAGQVVGAVNVLVDVTDHKRAEVALQQSEAQLRLVTDHAPVLLVHCDRDARFTFVNRRYADRLGLTPQEIIGRHIPDVIGDAAYASFRKYVERTLTGQHVEFEVEIPYEKIGPHVMRCSCAPDFGPDGRVRGLVAVLADVTERNRAEEALRDSEQRFARFMQHLPGLAWIKDTRGRYVYANEAAEKAFCTPRADLYGKTDAEVFPPEVAARFSHNDRQAVSGGSAIQVVETLEHEDGTLHHSIVTKFPIQRPDGEVAVVGGMAIDITDQRRAEEDVRHSEERFRSLMEQAPFSIQVFSPDGRTIRVNRAWEELWGVRFEQIEGYNILEDKQLEARGILHYIHQGFAGQAVRTPAIQYDPNETIPGVTEQKDPRRWLSAVIYPIKDADGRVREVVLIHEDITARHRAEAELRDARSRLDAALEAGAIVTWTWDIPNNRLFSDDNLARLFNLPPSEAAGGSLDKYIRSIHPDDWPRVSVALNHSVESGGDYEADYRIVQPDGSVRWVVARGRVQRDERGRPVRMPGVLVDITERKRLEEELRVRVEQLAEADRRKGELLASLRESEEKMRLLADTIPQLAWMARPDGHIFWYNRRWYEYTGTTPEEMQGWAWQSVHDPDVLPKVLERWKGAITSGEPFDMVFPLKGADGRFHPFLTRVNPLRDEAGRILYWFGTNTDISEIKRMEAALRDADRRKDEFLATLAHELRNPLAPIRNSLQILKMPRVDAETAGRTREMMERQVQHLVRLVDDLLDVSRVMRGKIELRREPVELATVVARAVETVKPLIEVQGHELSISLPPDSLPLDADPVRLAQVVGNLLTNSAKYTEPNGHIRVSARREGGEAVLSVRDDGIGIAPDMLPHVFELFVQADHSSTKAQGGLGIGLTLVKNLVEMHGGRVEAHSAGLGQGCEFVVRLPVTLQHAQPGDEGAAEPNRVAPASGHRLLVVDDNIDAATSLTLLLQLQGHDVQVAHDGPSALAIATAFRPDLIFLDIGMPGMDGYEVARRVRKTRGLEDVVLAALTGWGQPEDRRRTAEAGFDHHLVKPPEPEAIEGVLAILNRR